MIFIRLRYTNKFHVNNFWNPHTISAILLCNVVFFIGWVCRVLVCHFCEQCRHPKYKVMTHFNCTLSDNQHSFIACNPGRKIILFYRELKFPRTIRTIYWDRGIKCCTPYKYHMHLSRLLSVLDCSHLHYSKPFSFPIKNILDQTFHIWLRWFSDGDIIDALDIRVSRFAGSLGTIVLSRIFTLPKFTWRWTF